MKSNHFTDCLQNLALQHPKLVFVLLSGTNTMPNTTVLYDVLEIFSVQT